ncbi:MAG TPA: sulfite exporter TauE/SafE family protein [Clostridiaceae bacterium]|nr:sulfite exporter TauE/SafE family protein [Clostridiaceae bacterium]
MNNKRPDNTRLKGGIKSPAVKKYVISGIIGLITGTINGLLGSGGGTIAVPAMVHLLSADEHKAHATAILVILPITIISVFFYISNDFVDWGITYKVILGGMLGGYAGAKILNLCPESILRKIFGAFMILAAVRMLMK